jgi:hypothetical protein
VRDDRPLQIQLVKYRHIRQSQEFQNIRVLQRIDGRTGGNRQVAAFRQHLFRFGAFERSFVIKRLDLPLQGALVPAAFNRFSLVKIPGFEVVHPHQGAVVGPGELRGEGQQQFVTRWVLNWRFQ